MSEEWRTIKDYPHYEVSSEGRVRRKLYYTKCKDGRLITRKSFIKRNSLSNGYPVISLSDGKGRRNILVHRLVAEAFIPNPNKKDFVDHINTIRSDNRVSNLKWVSRLENNNNSLTIAHMRESRRNYLIRNPQEAAKRGEIMKERYKSDKAYKERILSANLNPVTRKQRIKNNPQRKTVVKLDSDGNVCGEYISGGEAARQNGLTQKVVWSHCKNHKPLSDGSRYIYKEEL